MNILKKNGFKSYIFFVIFSWSFTSFGQSREIKAIGTGGGTPMYVYRKMEIMTKDNKFVVQFPKNCLSHNERELSDDIANLYLNSDYVPINEVGCKDTIYDYRNFTKTNMSLAYVPFEIELRLDVFFWWPLEPTTVINMDQSNEGYYPFKSYSTWDDYTSIDAYSFWETNPAHSAFITPDITSSTPPLAFSSNERTSINLIKNVTSNILPLRFEVGFPGKKINYFMLHDFGIFSLSDNFNGSNLELYQLRTPGTRVLENNLSTVFKMVLSIDRDDLVHECSKLGRKITSLKNIIDADKDYMPLLEKITQKNSNFSLREIFMNYFFETQETISKTITYLNQNRKKYGIDGDMIIENFQALAIIKENSCVGNWTKDQLKNNPAEFLNTVATCNKSGKINSLQEKMIRNFIEIISGEKDAFLSEKIFQEIKNKKEENEKARIQLNFIKIKTSDLLLRLNGSANSLCKEAIGQSNL